MADRVWKALTADGPLLRYLVGRDAEGLCSYRAGISDEEWIERQAVEDDAAFREWLGGIVGVSIEPLTP